MSALDELAVQCMKRGWRLSLDGTYVNGRHQEGLVINRLEVRTSPRTDRELLASVVAGPDSLVEAAVDAAQSLARQGLIA